MSLSGAQNKGLKSALERQKRKRLRCSGKEQIDSDYIIFHKGLMEIKELLIRTSSNQL